MTLTLRGGAYEVDDRGDFAEFRGNGFRLLVVSPESMVLEMPEGTRLRVRSASPILVTPEEPR